MFSSKTILLHDFQKNIFKINHLMISIELPSTFFKFSREMCPVGIIYPLLI
jgi:hypothetical protein